MPLYEYKCRECGVRFEYRQHISEDPLKLCPECGGEVYRLIQPVGVIFKGAGFYVTDHRSKSSTAAPGNNNKTEEKSAKSSSDSGKSSGEGGGSSK